MTATTNPENNSADMYQQRLLRREQLAAELAPKSKMDYLVTLKSETDSSKTQIQLCYVPDKYVLNRISFEHYLSTLNQTNWQNLETLALEILDDINNEVVPRWAQIVLNSANDKSSNGHRVLVEDRQPNWENVSLLRHLK